MTRFLGSWELDPSFEPRPPPVVRGSHRPVYVSHPLDRVFPTPPPLPVSLPQVDKASGRTNIDPFFNERAIEQARINISAAELTPVPLDWKTVANPQQMDTQKGFGLIYCIYPPETVRVTHAIVYPDDKRWLRGMTCGVSLNWEIARACCVGGWTVKFATLGGTDPKAVKDYYGQPRLDQDPRPAYAVGGYWIDFDDFNSTELVTRWLIHASAFKNLPARYHQNVKDFISWGEDPSYHRVRTPPIREDGIPESPTKRLHVSMADIVQPADPVPTATSPTKRLRISISDILSPADSVTTATSFTQWQY